MPFSVELDITGICGLARRAVEQWGQTPIVLYIWLRVHEILDDNWVNSKVWIKVNFYSLKN